MSDISGALKKIKDFLHEKSEQVLDLEKKAQEAIHIKKEEAEYKKLMKKKAELLAMLFTESEVFLKDLNNSAESEEIREQIKAFSQNAKKSIELGSVFFMSALLYNDDHKKDEDNNLQKFIEKLKERIKN